MQPPRLLISRIYLVFTRFRFSVFFRCILTGRLSLRASAIARAKNRPNRRRISVDEKTVRNARPTADNSAVERIGLDGRTRRLFLAPLAPPRFLERARKRSSGAYNARRAADKLCGCFEEEYRLRRSLPPPRLRAVAGVGFCRQGRSAHQLSGNPTVGLALRTVFSSTLISSAIWPVLSAGNSGSGGLLVG
jgi:hypothetical protein